KARLKSSSPTGRAAATAISTVANPTPANPRVSAKLQSRLIMLGPRKDAVRRPQHGYRVWGIAQ
ncbi:hypothetical protein, partial [uncultured Muribaculum sp.]|uniref:hypothetical protein n=1 Tax=uncultured Muribaculum sp. TaxID=1918613 RepID=UPI002711FFC0